MDVIQSCALIIRGQAYSTQASEQLVVPGTAFISAGVGIATCTRPSASFGQAEAHLLRVVRSWNSYMPR